MTKPTVAIGPPDARTNVCFRETAEVDGHFALQDDDAIDPAPRWGQPIFDLTHNTQLAVWRENGFRIRDGVLAIRKELPAAVQIAA
jgi:hypothetical protein